MDKAASSAVRAFIAQMSAQDHPYRQHLEHQRRMLDTRSDYLVKLLQSGGYEFVPGQYRFVRQGMNFSDVWTAEIKNPDEFSEERVFEMTFHSYKDDPDVPAVISMTVTITPQDFSFTISYNLYDEEYVDHNAGAAGEFLPDALAHFLKFYRPAQAANLSGLKSHYVPPVPEYAVPNKYLA